MSFEEKLFQRFYKWIKPQKSAQELYPWGLPLSAVLAHLEILAKALAEENITLAPCRIWECSLINSIVLPPLIAVYKEDTQNRDLYLLRIVHHLWYVKQNIFLSSREEKNSAQAWKLALQHLPDFVRYLQEENLASRLLPALFRDSLASLNILDANQAWQNAASVAVALSCPPSLSRTSVLNTLSLGLKDEKFGPNSLSKNKIDLKVSTLTRPEKKDLEKSEENPLSHVFEKILTAEEYNSGNKSMDGSDETEDHAQALQELTLRHVVRTHDKSQSFLRSDAIVDSLGVESAPADTTQNNPNFYPEWNFKNRSYRPNYCIVYEHELLKSKHSDAPIMPSVVNSNETTSDALKLKFNASLILNSAEKKAASFIRAKVLSLFNSEIWKNRQIEGPELDMDALINFFSGGLENRTVPQNIFVNRMKLEKDLALLVLLDASDSTDSWTENKRILDLIKSSMMILGDALRDFESLFAIASFRSETRSNCHFQWLKHFKDTWREALEELDQLKPSGHTRIGAILRHSTSIMQKTKARRKAIILISDGKPSDLDQYEGIYGNSDVRKAVTELHSQQIIFRALITPQKRNTQAAAIFGAGNYHQILSAQSLADDICSILIQLMRH